MTSFIINYAVDTLVTYNDASDKNSKTEHAPLNQKKIDLGNYLILCIKLSQIDIFDHFYRYNHLYYKQTCKLGK